ncbi:MAG: SAM-dependent methyltransferase [Phycisphaerales bacterium]|jgi:SAM-dependent methyltransferase
MAQPDVPETPSPYLDPYRDAVAKVGPRFEALLWQSAEAQHTRFAVLAQMKNPTGRVIVDLGCGRADLASFLHGRGVEYGSYIGVDGVEELATAARDRLSEEGVPECTVLVRDFVADEGLYRELVRERRADTLVFSGSLNTFDQDLAERTLDAAFDALEPGGVLIFNFLSDRAGADRRSQATGPATRFDTARLVGWALDRSPLVRFRQDYLKGHDATIMVEKV